MAGSELSSYDQKQAGEVADLLFAQEATVNAMTPALCHKVLVTSGPLDTILVSIGSAGSFAMAEDESSIKAYYPTAKVVATVALTRSAATALAASLTKALADGD